jgi:hypothetical protein
MAGRQDSGDTAAEVRARDAIAFRLHAHHLTDRRPTDALHDVTGACGVQNSPPGSALLALHARVEHVTPDLVDHLIGTEKSLLHTWSMRGAPFHLPTDDAPVFTTGVLPTTEKARLRLIIGVEQALDGLGLGLDAVVDLITEEIGPVLSGRRLEINGLGEELAERVATRLSPRRRTAWREDGPYAANQPLGEAVVHFCVRILALRGVVCFAPRSDNTAPFVLLEEWLGRPLPQVDPDSARAALLRRYLHCYGPSTRADFAAWVGVRAGDVDPWWTALEDELTPVGFGGRRAWILSDDLDALRSPPAPRGVRLLPPRDPYTQLRDRDTIVDRKHHREVWRTTGGPGAVLADGAVVGTWRPRKSGSTLTLAVTVFQPSGTDLRTRLREEAEHVAALRGASEARLEFDD